MTVMAATAWPSNAELIEACAELGYLKKSDAVLDPTYGRGTWWKRWKPDDLTALDARADLSFNRHDFTDLPAPDNLFDVVAYDPPYVCVGGRATTGTPDMHDRYGMTDAPRTPLALQRLINDGLKECARVVKPKGLILCKVQDYVSSGRLWIGTHHTLSFGLSIGLELVDRLEMIGAPRPQPPGRRQVHARRNLSTMFILKKGTR
jgi:DNA modification methylase